VVAEAGFRVNLFSKVIVAVGGCSFLGFNIVKLLHTPLCTSSVKGHELKYKGVEYHACDITGKSHMTSLLDSDKPKVVINTISPHCNDTDKAASAFRNFGFHPYGAINPTILRKLGRQRMRDETLWD
jgi:dTDP-4-dehydrorhamnose reductase